MAPPVPISLAAIHARLDRLAALGRAGVDVHGLLGGDLNPNGGDDTMERKAVASVTVRCAPEVLEEADRLAVALADTPEARAAGGHWGRAAILRLALDRGLRSLAGERRGGA